MGIVVKDLHYFLEHLGRDWIELNAICKEENQGEFIEETKKYIDAWGEIVEFNGTYTKIRRCCTKLGDA